MHLKRLEIHGFKSFANRTTLEFGQGITAIIGPNGSGKSNIADALRWVLGEQSGRTMRARKLEDVIFVGSTRRNPSGLAEVNLTLDNTERWLPVEFSEVVVTRRVYRSGESEYLINNQRVRLKDVTDLFLRANLGQNSYAIMGQGMVDMVLSLRPEERRGLIEEAADVRRHRVRMEEARQRLAATRENMERLRLLVAELEPRLVGLRRQAERAAEYLRLTQELALALREWYAHQWDAACRAAAAARARHEERQEELRAAAAELERLESRLAAVRSERAERREAVAALGREVRDLEAAVQRLEQRQTLARERHGMTTARLDEVRRDAAALEEELAGYAGGPEDLAARTAELDRRLAEAEALLRARQQEWNELEQSFSSERARMAEAEERAARLRAAAEDVEGRLGRLERDESRLARQALERAGRRKAMLGELRRIGQEFLRITREDARLEARLDDLTSHYHQTLRQIEAFRGTIGEADEKLRSEQRELQHLQERLALLERRHAESAGLNPAVQAVTRAAGQVDQEGRPLLPGVLGVLVDAVEVPRGLERAIEAALEESLQAVVVERQEDAFAIVQFLQQQGAGRATVYPLEGLRVVRPLVMDRERGVIGVASELVRCDAAFRPLIDTLLGRVIVVEDLGTGLAVLGRGLGSVVTPDGVVVRPGGAVAGGWRKNDRGLLAFQTELKSLPREVERLAAQVEARTAELAQRRRTLADLERRAPSMAAELDRLRQERFAGQETLARLRGRISRLRGEMHWLYAAGQQAADDLAALAREREELARRRDEYMVESVRARREAERLRAASQEEAQRRAALQQAVGEARAAVAALEGERRSLHQLQESQAAARRRLESQLAARRSQLEELAAEQERLRRELEETGRDLGAQRGRLEAARTELRPASGALHRLEEEERRLEQERESARGRLLAAERRALEAETELGRRTEEREALRAAIEAEGMLATDTGDVVPREFTVTGGAWDAGQVAGEDGEPAGAEEPAGGLPPVAGGSGVDPVELRRQVDRLRARIRSLGPVNPQAEADYEEARARYDFLTAQIQDLEEAERQLLEAIDELKRLIQERFTERFTQVAAGFARYFRAFFGGGTAQLTLTDAGDLDAAGVEIEAQPPGKRLQSLALLSGGERALTAVALLFALLETNPAPFCVLDEVDAALDEANVGRFGEALRDLAGRTQFVVITHNRRTIEMADQIYGVTMAGDGASRLLSLRLSDLAPT